MTDRRALNDPNDTPEDVATLYTWANLHGAKYRDFSASRAQTREKARLRVQEAIEEERRRARAESEASQAAEAQRQAEASRQAELEAQQAAQEAARVAAEQAAVQAAQQAAEQAAQLAAQRAAEEAAQQAAAQRNAEQLAAQQVAAQRAAEQQAAQLAARQAAAAQQQAARQAELAAQQAVAREAELAAQQAAQQAANQRAWQAQRTESATAYPTAVPAQAPVPYYPPPPEYPAREFPGRDYPPRGFAGQRDYGSRENPSFDQAQTLRPTPIPPQYPATRDDSLTQPRNPWSPVDPPASARPAWLTSERSEVSARPSPPVTDDTLQGSRDRLTSRWFALKGVFDGSSAPVEPAPVPVTARPPVVAIFSLAGGVGKTSIVATLGRALSARGERVLLVDTAAYGLLPFFFGARDQRPGVLRTFSPPGASGDAPIQLITMDPETLGPETPALEPLSAEISKYSRGVGRVIVDLATASGATTRRVMRMNPLVLVPVIPDMSSVVSVGSIESFFQHNQGTAGKPQLPYYVLNQFDPSLPLHLDVREVLREQLGDRLLPFAIRRTPAVSEGLAEGMTVMDYAPNSTVADDFGSLAGWVKSQSAPANTSYRGVRWSER
jgi:cellulose synthase operon protein YhjQ